jgi:glycosyltransferase involved in cell wall biosynthesis
VERCSIALVSDWYPPRIGGVERQLEGLANALAARGHDVRVLTSSRGGVDSNGVPVVRFDLPLFAHKDVARPVPRLLRQLYEWLEHNRVDVVHAHGVFSSTAHAGVITADELGIASVLTNHSLIRPGLRPLARLIFLGCGYRADLVTAVSHAAATDLRRVSGRADVTVIPNGIDLTTVGATPRASPTGGEVRIIFVGRLVTKKNPSDLVAAVPRVLDRVPDPSRVRFIVVGEGPARARLERQAQQLGVAGRIDFVGHQTHAEVQRLLDSAQILASPVRNEAFGIAILEARAAGLPVVAMSGGGVGEIISEGRHGLIAQTADDFVDGLVRLVSDEPLRRAMAEATVTGLEPFGWDAVVKRHVEIYRRAVADRGGRRRRPWRFRSR